MNICIALAIYSAMTTAHVDTQANHVKINEGGKFLEQKCEEFKTAEEKKAKKEEKKSAIGDAKVDKK